MTLVLCKKLVDLLRNTSSKAKAWMSSKECPGLLKCNPHGFVLSCLILIGSKVMTQNEKTQMILFYKIAKNGNWKCSAPQNDRLNLSFVKDIHVVGRNICQKSS